MYCGLSIVNQEMQEEAPATNPILSMPGMNHDAGCACPGCISMKSPGTMNSQQATFIGHDTVDIPISDAVDKKARNLGLNKPAEYTLEKCCRQEYAGAGEDVAAAYLVELGRLPQNERTEKYVAPLNGGARPIV